MNNELTIIKNDLGNVRGMVSKLAQSMGLTNEVLSELTSGITEIVSAEVKGQVKEEIITAKQEMYGEVMVSVGNTISESVKTAVAERGLNRQEISRLTKARNYRMIQLLGNPKSDLYLIFAPFYFCSMAKDFKKKFECAAYGDVNANDFNEAVLFLENWSTTPSYHEWCKTTLHKNYKNNEIESNKILNAYKRYFNIED